MAYTKETKGGIMENIDYAYQGLKEALRIGDREIQDGDGSELKGKLDRAIKRLTSAYRSL